MIVQTTVTYDELEAARGGVVPAGDASRVVVICPDDYDAATITAADILHDPAIVSVAVDVAETTRDGETVWQGNAATYYSGCRTCERELRTGNTFFPSHRPSYACQSSKRSHCTCDGCF